MEEEHNKAFLERKKLLELERDNFRERHELKMKEMKYARESEAIMFDHQLQLHRLKRADRSREYQRKEAFAQTKGYRDGGY